MAERVQVEKPAPSEKVTAEVAARMAEQAAEVQAAQAKPGADLSEIDDFLDEIDALLEDTSVATTYRQRGGE